MTSFDSSAAQANYPTNTTLPLGKAQPLSDTASKTSGCVTDGVKHNALSAFHWKDDPRPSVFATDRAFVANASGQTTSQTASKAVQAFEQKHGRSQGTVYGVSAAADRATAEFQDRIAQRKVPA
jgi:hypothetical protein